jgi:hypothetical protein
VVVVVVMFVGWFTFGGGFAWLSGVLLLGIENDGEHDTQV